MGIMDKLEMQQREQSEVQQTSEILSELLDRLEGIEKNQRAVVKASNETTQNMSRVWVELEQMQQQMQQREPCDASANDLHEKTLTKLAMTQIEILELLGSSKSVSLPDGSAVTVADVSAHGLMLKVRDRISVLETTNSRLADEVGRKRSVIIDHEKLAGHLVPRLEKQLKVHEQAAQTAFTEASAPMLAELERGRTELSDAGARIHLQMRKAGEQVEKLGGVVSWRMVGQVSMALLPLALVTFVVFGMAQTIWAAFGLQPIMQTVWGGFQGASEWYWKLAIAGGAFVVLVAFFWLLLRLGKKLHDWYRGY